MHKLKDTKLLNYTSKAYTGLAFKLDGGVQAFEAYTAAYEADFSVLRG
jgi:hypothetical protein